MDYFVEFYIITIKKLL